MDLIGETEAGASPGGGRRGRRAEGRQEVGSSWDCRAAAALGPRVPRLRRRRPPPPERALVPGVGPEPGLPPLRPRRASPR